MPSTPSYIHCNTAQYQKCMQLFSSRCSTVSEDFDSSVLSLSFLLSLKFFVVRSLLILSLLEIHSALTLHFVLHMFLSFLSSLTFSDLNMIMCCQFFSYFPPFKPACPVMLANCDVFFVVFTSFLCFYVSTQFWGHFPFLCVHPGAHPILGRGAPSAPGPAAEPPTAPHSPAPSGSQRPPSHLTKPGPAAHGSRRRGPPRGPAGGPGESGWSLPV